MRIKIYITLIIIFTTTILPINFLNANNLTNQLKGKILLQVESNGEAFYLNPADNKRYYMGRPMDAYLLIKKLGVGITNYNLDKIEIGSGETYDKSKIDLNFAKSNNGKIFLQVEEQGQAWFARDKNNIYKYGQIVDEYYPGAF